MPASILIGMKAANSTYPHLHLVCLYILIQMLAVFPIYCEVAKDCKAADDVCDLTICYTSKIIKFKCIHGEWMQNMNPLPQGDILMPMVGYTSALSHG